MTVISDTSPAENFVLERRIDPNICSLYSPLMRRKWAEAHESGSFDEFLAYCRRRLGAYAQTISVAVKIKRLKLVRMKRVITLALLSVVYQVLERHVLVAEAGDEYLHGDATVGWHPTWYGAESARLIDLVCDGMANA